MKDVDKADLKGTVRTVTTERKSAGSVFVEERTFDTDGALLSSRYLRDGVPPADFPNQVSAESADLSIKSVYNTDGSRTDTQQVIACWSMEGLSVGLGTYGAVVARTTFDNRGVPVETVFLNAQNDETAKICYACDEKGRILQAIQSLRPGFMSTFPAETIEEFRDLLGPDGECCRLSFAYDDAGRVTESKAHFMGKQTHHAVTAYNSQGDKETITTGDRVRHGLNMSTTLRGTGFDRLLNTPGVPAWRTASSPTIDDRGRENPGKQVVVQFERVKAQAPPGPGGVARRAGVVDHLPRRSVWSLINHPYSPPRPHFAVATRSKRTPLAPFLFSVNPATVPRLSRKNRTMPRYSPANASLATGRNVEDCTTNCHVG